MAGELGGTVAGGPQQQAIRDPLAALELQAAGLDLDHRRVGPDLDALAAEQIAGVGAELGVEGGKDFRAGLDQGDANLIDQVGVVAAAFTEEQVVELGGDLDAGGSAAADDEVEQPRALAGRKAGQTGRFQASENPLADGSGIRGIFEKQRVLGDARDPVGIADSADGDDQPIELDGKFRAVRAGDAAAGRVDGDGAGKMEAHARLPDGHDDAAKLHRPDRGRGQQRGEDEMVARADDGDLVEARVDVANDAEGAEAGAEDDQSGPQGCASSRRIISGRIILMSLRYFDEIEAGEEYLTPGVTVTEAHVLQFAGLSMDFFELHTNEEFARQTIFGRRVAHGLLGLAMADGLKNRSELRVRAIASLGWTWEFAGPIFIGDTIHVRMQVADKRASRSKPDRGVVTLRLEVRNQRGEVVQKGENRLMVERRAG